MTSSKQRKGFYFSFHGGTEPNGNLTTNHSNKGLTLADGVVGDRFKIIQPQNDHKQKQLNNYLQSVGLELDLKLTVISRTASGSVIVADGNHRIGLSAEISQQIEIVKVDSNSKNCQGLLAQY